MKKITLILLVTVLAFNLSNAQKKLKSIDTLDLNKVSALEVSSKFKNGFDAKTIILKDGSIIQIGSELIAGNPSNPLNVNNNVYNGVKVANTSIDFTYLMIGKYSIMRAMSPVYFGSSYSQTEIIVAKIRVYRTKKMIQFVVDFTNKDGSNTAMGKYGSILNLEKTLLNGEIINPNAQLTRSQAIAKLKESKELLDLDMMTKEEYDVIKTDLAPLIKGKL